MVDHLGAAAARVKWNGTYGPSDCTCWSEVARIRGSVRRLQGSVRWVQEPILGLRGRRFGPTVPTTRTVSVVRWYEHTSYGGFPALWAMRRGSSLLIP